MLGIIGLVLGTVILVIGAYKGFSALPLALAAGIVVVVTNGMNIFDAFSGAFMPGYVGFFLSFFLIFAASALYAKIMEETGAAMAIGYKFVDWFGAKKAVLIVFVTTAALTYGGISLFVVVFAISPIIMILFNEANIPRRLAMGPLLAGAATFTMKSLPGSPQATNIVPTEFLGTDLNAAPIFGIISAVLMFVAQYIYFKYEEKKLRESGEGFTFMEGTDITKYEVDRKDLPSAFLSFLPMVVVVAMIIIMSNLSRNGHLAIPVWGIVVLSMLVASTLAIIFAWDKVKNYEDGGLKGILNKGTGGAITAIAAPAAVVGFGALVQQTPAFREIVDFMLNMEMHPYMMAALPPSIIAGITGSSSGGLRIAMESLYPYYLASGADMGMMHRVSAMFAGTLDTLPHSPGLFLMFGYLGITHKEGYRFVFWGSVVIPTVIGIILLAIAMGIAPY